MPFQRDERYATEIGTAFGEYLTSFFSEPHGQVRADLFRNGKRVEAHVSFSTGVVASSVTEPYINALWEYARREGVTDRFRLILS